MSSEDFYYSPKYYDDVYEYRHVIIPKTVSLKLTQKQLYSENEWRSIGIQMSPGWVHYHWHKPDKTVLLFRRKLTKEQKQQQQKSGEQQLSDY
ncbi:cyclin-dependent kinases regulatory subunit [Anaeramoeba flamelloides]|uniref:Cyclin-dependent kinases regulatory subunit n=1 Tax=Anaeramoeba flamelloides TaxID=1746091 RepID=A0AAV8A0W7_9EUKA|nr:cyclin-dependent kinases regulatory subunit [Anaeramoeba flamelloides]KAJ6246540.1 cyclin-dependent kinases regulatory subunit [Anaeramoeba flamelloides]